MATRELTLEEKLARFADRWKNYQGTEMAGAQMFLRELQECYGIWYHEPGTAFEQHPVAALEERQDLMFGDAPARRNRGRAGQQRMDLYIPKVVVWEMKGPDEKDLQKHHTQLLLYWARMRTRFMVLCNFHEFWIYDTDVEGGQNEPQVRFPLAQLPENSGALNFLGGGETWFAQASAQVTREAAQYIGRFLRDLVHRSPHPEQDRPRYTKFTLECVFAMFAEDAGILPTKPFTLAMKSAQASGDLSPVYNLFDDLGRASEADRSNLVPYVNGPLFDREHPKVPVDKELLALLFVAADKYDWQAVRPEVFGSIFERALFPDERHAAGAHFTSEADIMKVVGPTIVRPWRERIKAAQTHKDIERLVERLRHYHVLDPACGSGNFLYVAYRELKRLELELRNKFTELYRAKAMKRASDRKDPPPGPYFTIQQLHGIDKLPEAVQLTRVVLWIAQYLANQELALGEITLPLAPLEQNVIEADALFTDWFRPPDDGISELAIVSNPPFLGRARMRLSLGDRYINELHAAFPNNRNADLVTYWYTQALETLRSGERAGFVSSNSIAQNESREASLDRIIGAGGTIHDAWKSYPWPGEAAVHVSIVNWIQSDYQGAQFLEGNAAEKVSSSLSRNVDLAGAARLERNLGLAFEGIKPGNNEFVIDGETRTRLIKEHPRSEAVIVPFLIGRDVNRTVDQSATRWIIDFNQMSIDDAKSFRSAFRYVQEHVYPARMAESDRKLAREKNLWWQFERPRPEMREALASASGCMVTPVTSPHLILVKVEPGTLIDHALKAITLGTDYHFGILQSVVHEFWAWARGSTLKGDLRYTNTTIFETFPFPLLPEGGYDPRVAINTRASRAVANVGRQFYTKRQEVCKHMGIGLTRLHNYINNRQAGVELATDIIDGLPNDDFDRVTKLRQLKAELNSEVCACYGWPEDTWRDENEVLSRLLALNQQLAG